MKNITFFHPSTKLKSTCCKEDNEHCGINNDLNHIHTSKLHTSVKKNAVVISAGMEH
jgi:hypothetical protein